MTSAPTDAAADAAYDQIAKIAREHCLIDQASGGLMLILTPAAQREAGIRERILRAHMMVEVGDE